MAANDGLIEGLAPGVLVELQAYNKEIVTAMGNIPKLNDFLKNTKTPANADASFKALTDQIKAQDKAIADLQKKLIDLAETKKNNNKLSVQERTDNSIILQQQKQQATIVSEVAGAYRRLSAEHAKAATNVQNIIARGKLANQTQRDYNKELRNATKEFNDLNAKVLKADTAVGRFQRNVGNYPQTLSAVNQLLGALGITLGAAGVAQFAKDIFDTTRELQSLDLALKQVIGSQEEAAATQVFLNKVSDDFGINIQVLTKAYTGFYASSKNAIDQGKISAEQIRDIFQSVAKAAGAMGLSVEQQEGAFLALSQMISKGNIQAEELRGQLSERLPGAFGILAKSMGVTEKQLNKMLKDGEVLAAEVLPAFAKELEKAYGVENLNRVESLNASVTRLSNSWVDFVRALNDGDGVLQKSLAATLDYLADWVSRVSFYLQSAKTQRDNLNRDLRAQSAESAKDFLKKYETAAQKEEYAQNAIIKLRQRAAALTAEFSRLNDENTRLFEENVRKTPLGNIIPKNIEAEIEKNKTRQNEINQLLSRQYGLIDGLTEATKKQTKETKELTKEQIEAAKRLAEEAAKNKYERELSDLERSKFLIEQDLKNEELSRDEKIKLQKDLATAEFLIITRKYQEQDRLAKGNFDKLKIAANEYLTALDSLAKPTVPFPAVETGLEIPVVDEKQAEDSKQYIQDIIDLFKQWREEQERLTAATDDFIGGFYEDFKSDSGISAVFDLVDGTFADLLKGAQDYVDDQGNLVDRSVQRFAVGFQAITEAAQQAYNMINEAQQKNFDAEYQRLEAQKNIAIAFAGESDVARAEVERQAEQRRKEIDKREQKAKQDAAVVNTVINTAQAVVSALATANNIYAGIALAAFAAGVGAAQIAIIKSQKVPEYYKGTDNAPAGWAWTQERGAEIITDRQGRIKTLGSDKGAQLTKLDAGDKVFTADKSKEMMNDIYLNRILSERGINQSPAIVNVSAQPALTQAHVNQIVSAIQTIPVAENYIEDGDFKYAIRKGTQRQQIMNARATQKGFTTRG